MKKLLMATACLSLFAIVLSLVQISCSKANAQNATQNLIQLNKIVYYRQLQSDPVQIWTANYDGTGQTQVPIALPIDVQISGDILSGIRLSPDGQKIFFTARVTVTGLNSIYSCNIDGSNVQLVVEQTADIVRLGGAY